MAQSGLGWRHCALSVPAEGRHCQALWHCNTSRLEALALSMPAEGRHSAGTGTATPCRRQALQFTIRHCVHLGIQAVGAVGLSELSELSDEGVLSELSDCRTDGRQWKTVDERGAMSCTVGITVGHCRNCRTFGLSDLSDCRITVGLLSESTVGLSDRGSEDWLPFYLDPKTWTHHRNVYRLHAFEPITLAEPISLGLGAQRAYGSVTIQTSQCIPQKRTRTTLGWPGGTGACFHALSHPRKPPWTPMKPFLLI